MKALSTETNPVAAALAYARETLTEAELADLLGWLRHPEILAEARTMSASAVACAIRDVVAHKVAWRGEVR